MTKIEDQQPPTKTPKGKRFAGQTGTQDFYKLRDQHAKAGTLFEDPQFRADDSVLYYTERYQKENIHFEWKRPKEICENPKVFVGGFSRFDIKQGALGDCWFLAATATLAQDRKLFTRVVPKDNSFDENYAGIFHFNFWHFGKWTDIVIDDRLPTINGKLAYMKSSENNEFWSALIEKAYAKMYGSYKALDGGSSSEALVDFTGGIIERVELGKPPKNLFQIIEKGFARHSLMCCSVKAVSGLREPTTPQGLVCGHAYSITKCKAIDCKGQKAQLLRLRNPWGNDTEWNGAWSDGSDEWKSVSDATKKEIGLTNDEDGEFWMSYPDFCNYFSYIEMCNLSPDSLTEEHGTEGKKWNTNVFEGEWAPGSSAGGCQNHNSFPRNPQYIVKVEQPDENDDEGKCTVVVALMQKYRRFLRNKGIDNNLYIGFRLFPVSKETLARKKPLKDDFFDYTEGVGGCLIINSREVTQRFEVQPGNYVVVPFTFEPDLKGKFMIRVFSESLSVLEENDEEIGEDAIDDQIADETPEHDADALFYEYCTPNEEIGWKGMNKVLDYLMKDAVKDFKGFSKGAARSMVAMADLNMSGSLNLQEFKPLVDIVSLWRVVFDKFSKDAYSINSSQLRDALATIGYRVNNKILNTLVHRFGAKDGTIEFDDFLMCAVKVKSAMDKFKKREKDSKASFNLDEFVTAVLCS